MTASLEGGDVISGVLGSCACVVGLRKCSSVFCSGSVL